MGTAQVFVSIDSFKKELMERPEFRHVTVVESQEWSNAVLVGGDALGENASDELSSVGRRHGLVVLADRLSVWFSKEDMKKYGRKSLSEHDVLKSSGTIVNIEDWKRRKGT